MILELDCGNTRIKWRLRGGGNIYSRGDFLVRDGLSPMEEVISAERSIARVLISSVLGDDFGKKIANWFLAKLTINPEFAESELRFNGVTNGYQHPEKLGVDRWLAILAAKSKTPKACVIVDCGSAITVDLVTAQGEHLGGYIAPGLRLMRESLVANTAAIKLTQIGYPDDVFPGRNTVVAIKAAELAMILGLVDQAKTILRHYDLSEPVLQITGGDGQWLSSQLKNSQFQEDLVMDGLSIALSANNK